MSTTYAQSDFTATTGTNITAYTPNVGPSWVSNGTYTIQSNALANSTHTSNDTVCAQDAGHADVTFTCTFTTPGSAYNGGIVFGYLDAANFWLIDIQPGSITLYKKISGSYTSVATSSTGQALSTTAAYKVYTWGDYVNIQQNGTTLINYSVSARPLKTATGVGCRCDTSGLAATGTWDSYLVISNFWTDGSYSAPALPKPSFPTIAHGPLGNNLVLATLATEGSGTSAADYSGNGWTATVHGGNWAGGNLGWSLNGDGTSSYYTSTSLQNLNFSSGSVSWWMKPNLAWADNAIHGLWGQRNNGTGKEFDAQKFSDNNFYIGWVSGATDSRILLAASPDNYTPGQWQHYVFVWVVNSMSQLWRNGVLIAQKTNVSPQVSNVASNWEWMRENAAQYFNGQMDAMLVFNKQLSSPEIEMLYFDSFATFRHPRHAWLHIPGQTIIASCSLSETDTLGPTGTRTRIGIASLAETDTLGPTATRKQVASTSLTETDTLGPTGTRTQHGSTSLAEADSLTPAATRIRLAACALSELDVLSPSALRTQHGTVALVEADALSPSATKTVIGVCSLHELDTLAATGIKVIVAQCSFSEIDVLSPNGSRVVSALCDLFEIDALTAAGIVARPGGPIWVVTERGLRWLVANRGTDWVATNRADIVVVTERG